MDVVQQSSTSTPSVAKLMETTLQEDVAQLEWSRRRQSLVGVLLLLLAVIAVILLAIWLIDDRRGIRMHHAEGSHRDM